MPSYYEKPFYRSTLVFFITEPMFCGNNGGKVQCSFSVVQLIEMIFFNCFIFIDLSCELIGAQIISKTENSFQTPVQLE